MLTLIHALMMGVGFQEIGIALIVFAVPLFFLVRLILGKLWASGSRQSINIVSVVLAIILSPVFGWITIMALIVAYGVH